MSLKYNSLLLKVKNEYRKESLEFYIKRFYKSEIFLKSLVSDGVIRGFIIINKRKIKVLLRYTKEKTPSLTSIIRLAHLKKRNTVGLYNFNKLSKDFNILYVNDSLLGLHSYKQN